MVEHSLGKGEVESSILSCSTINFNELVKVVQVLAGPSRLIASGGADLDETRADRPGMR